MGCCGSKAQPRQRRQANCKASRKTNDKLKSVRKTVWVKQVFKSSLDPEKKHLI